MEDSASDSDIDQLSDVQEEGNKLCPVSDDRQNGNSGSQVVVPLLAMHNIN